MGKFNIISKTRSDFSYSKINYVLECNRCGRIYELQLDEKYDIDKLGCDCDNVVDTHIKLDSNVDFKLKRTWKRVYNDLCSEWKEDFNNFKDWAYSNGYKPWMNLNRKDANLPYSKENCYFKLNKIVYSKEYIDNIDSNRSKSVCLISNVNNRVSNICNDYLHLKEELDKLKSSSDVDLDIIDKMENQLNKVNKSISKIREMVVTIDLKK